MTQKELYAIYAKWTGTLHFYCVRELDRHIDCEYLPDTYQFKLYSGFAEESYGTVPGLTRPPGERSETVKLYRPEDHPTYEQLDELFRQICLAAARVLRVQLGRKELRDQDSAQRDLERNVAGPLRIKDS